MMGGYPGMLRTMRCRCNLMNFKRASTFYWSTWLLGGSFALLILGAMCVRAAEAVDMELALLVDVSGSIEDDEFILQRHGYAEAFRSADIQAAIDEGTYGSIAVTLVYWAGGGSQFQAVDWTRVGLDGMAPDAFADLIETTERRYKGLTAPGSALNFIYPQFADNGFEALRQEIDVSGDGKRNSGDDTASARDAALAAGIDRINGLVIGSDAGIFTWYQDNVQGGEDAFTLQVNSFDVFALAIQKKIEAEIRGGTVPEPAPWMLCGMVALVGMARRLARRRG